MLFPGTFAVHLVEEYLAPEWFGAWSGRVLDVPMSRSDFIVWNAIAFVLMCVGAGLTIACRRHRWIEIAMSLAVAGNALFHAAASVATLTYSPGLLTGVLLWLPLTVVRLPVALRESSPRGRRIGLLVGVSAVIVPLVVLASASRS